MHHTNSIARACFVSKGTVVFLFLLFPLLFPASSVQADDDRCDSKLGRNYDKQTAEVKMARMKVYMNCRHRQDFQFLQSKRKDMLSGIQKWEHRANRVTRSSLVTKNTIAMEELKTVHKTERGDLKANFRNQYAELAGAPATDHKTMSEKKSKITLAFRDERKDLQSLQKQEVSSLINNFSQCHGAVNNNISQLKNGDTANIHQQFLDKSARLKREYDNLKSGPMSMSPNDYAASQSSVPQSARGMSAGDQIGTIQTVEGTGSGTVTSPSGETVEASPGTPINQGDIVEMGKDVRCKIVFADETEVVIGEDSRLEIDEYVYEPDSDGGEETHPFGLFLRGVFVFTSGLIGEKEASDVDIAYGNIGIRG